MNRKKQSLLFLTCLISLLTACGKKDTAIESSQVTVMPVQTATETSDNTASSIGRFCYYPYNEESLLAPAGTNEIILYFEKNDIVPNTGYISIYNSFTGILYDTIDVSDSKRCMIGDFDETAIQYSGWNDGSCIHLFFDKSFELDTTYYITMEEACFMTIDEQVCSQEQTPKDGLFFGTTTYGLNAADTSVVDIFAIGDTWNIGIYLDQTAVSAIITEYDGRKVSFDKTTLTSSGNFTIEFLSSGDSSIEISFYDAAGNKVNSVSFSFSISV